MIAQVALALLCAHSALASFKSFAGYTVLEIQTPNEQIVNDIYQFVDDYPDSNLWHYPMVGTYAHLMLSRTDRATFDSTFGLNSSVFLEDVEGAVRATMVKSQAWFEAYHPLAELDQYLFDLVEKFSTVPGLNIETFELGLSWENRTIYGVKLSGRIPSQRIVWNGAIHAREWIAPATIHYVLNELLEGYASGDPRVVNIVDRIEFHIIPVLNPDGYEYSWTTNRMWRKTRSSYNAPAAYGTDPNRNWNFKWGEQGASRNPSSDTYCGPFPQSEPEVDQWARYLSTLTNVRGYLDWHSYGFYLLSPWGWTTTPPPDSPDMVGLGQQMNVVMREVSGNNWRVGPSSTTLYLVSGGGKDYTYAVENIKYSYTVELSGNPGGFVLPPEYIIPQGEEIWPGVLVYCEQIINEFA